MSDTGFSVPVFSGFLSRRAGRHRNAGICPAPGRSATRIVALHCRVAHAVRLLARRATDRIEDDDEDEDDDDDDDEDEDDSREALAEGDRRLATARKPVEQVSPPTRASPGGAAELTP